MDAFPPLDPDETILWEGQPDTKLRFGIETMATGIFAVALILACLGLATVIDRSEPGYFWPILLPGLLLGVVIVMAFPLLDSLARRKTRYRLTNKHAVIQGTKTASRHPIPPIDDLIYRNGTPPSIYFSTRPTHKGRRVPQDVGFERIAEAREVFIMMRERAEALHP